jgi:hypothetical protein
MDGLNRGKGGIGEKAPGRNFTKFSKRGENGSNGHLIHDPKVLVSYRGQSTLYHARVLYSKTNLSDSLADT